MFGLTKSNWCEGICPDEGNMYPPKLTRKSREGLQKIKYEA